MAPARLQLDRHTKSRTHTLRASHAGPHARANMTEAAHHDTHASMSIDTAHSRRFALLGGHGAIIFFAYQRLVELPSPVSQEEYAASAVICGISFIGLIAAYFAMLYDNKPRLAGILEGFAATIIFLCIAGFIALMIILAMTPVELRSAYGALV